MIIKKTEMRKFGSPMEQKLPDSFENFENLKEKKITVQWVRLRLHLLNVQYDPWKLYFPVTWEIMDKNIFPHFVNSWQAGVPERTSW